MVLAARLSRLKASFQRTDRTFFGLCVALAAVVFVSLAALSWRGQAANYAYGLTYGFTAHGTYEVAGPSAHRFVVDAIGPKDAVEWTLYRGSDVLGEGELVRTANPNYYRVFDAANRQVGTFSVVESSGLGQARAYLDHDGAVSEYRKVDAQAASVRPTS
jgi:hypothetical protein